jgi:hypothetical protein
LARYSAVGKCCEQILARRDSRVRSKDAARRSLSANGQWALSATSGFESWVRSDLASVFTRTIVDLVPRDIMVNYLRGYLNSKSSRLDSGAYSPSENEWESAALQFSYAMLSLSRHISAPPAARGRSDYSASIIAGEFYITLPAVDRSILP